MTWRTPFACQLKSKSLSLKYTPASLNKYKHKLQTNQQLCYSLSNVFSISNMWCCEHLVFCIVDGPCSEVCFSYMWASWQLNKLLGFNWASSGGLVSQGEGHRQGRGRGAAGWPRGFLRSASQRLDSLNSSISCHSTLDKHSQVDLRPGSPRPTGSSLNLSQRREGPFKRT